MALLIGEVLGFVGKVGDEQVPSEPDADCNNALQNEDPAPAFDASFAVKLRHAPRHDVTEARDDLGADIEESVAGGHLLARVPAGNEECRTRIESRFEATEDCSQSGKLLPCVDEAHRDHDCTPEGGGSAQPPPGTKFAQTQL